MKNNGLFLKLKSKICIFYKNNKKLFFMILTCVILIFVLFASSISTIKSKNNQKTNSLASSSEISDYAEKVETKLVSLLSKLDSVKSVDVFVVVETTPEINYLTETKETTVTNSSGSTSEITTTVVFEKNGSISTPVVVTTLMPKIKGVLIVTNKINASVKISIINSISTVLNVDQSCISLLQES